MTVIHNCSWLKFFGYGYKDSVSGEKACGLFVLNVFRIVPGGRFVPFCKVLACVSGESSTFVTVSTPFLPKATHNTDVHGAWEDLQ